MLRRRKITYQSIKKYYAQGRHTNDIHIMILQRNHALQIMSAQCLSCSIVGGHARACVMVVTAVGTEARAARTSGATTAVAEGQCEVD
jgi:hypothetical protein